MSRELDKQIAEKVMGLEPCDNPIGRCDAAEAGICYGVRGNDGIVRGSDLKPYSADIAAAWEVVEKMREQGYAMIFDMFDDWYGVRFYHAGTGRPSGDSDKQNTAPEAMCRAALQAVDSDD